MSHRSSVSALSFILLWLHGGLDYIYLKFRPPPLPLPIFCPLIPFCQMVLFKAASRCCQCSVCSKIFHTQARAGALHTKGKCSSIVRCCICRISNELEPSESDSEQASTQVMILFTSQLIRFNMPFNSISGPLIPPVICVGDYSRTVRP